MESDGGKEGRAVLWSEQVEAWVMAMTQAQTKMWETWGTLMRFPFVVPSVFPRGADCRCEPVSQELTSWTAEPESAVRDTISRFSNAQHFALRSLALSMSAWMAMAPKIEAGEDWQTALRKYTDQFRQELLRGPQAMVRTFREVSELWRLSGEAWQKVSWPWAESLKQAPWHISQAVTGDGSALIELANLWWDAFERTIGCLLESPSLGHTRELNQDWLKGFDAWIEYRRATFEYQVIVGDAWAQVFGRFVQELVAHGEKGELVQGLRGLLFLWVDICDRVLGEVFRSEEYIRIQNRLVNTAAAYRRREAEIVEAFLKISHVPTRGELDEAYRRIYELRKEIKELKKHLRETKATPAAFAAREPEAKAT